MINWQTPNHDILKSKINKACKGSMPNAKENFGIMSVVRGKRLWIRLIALVVAEVFLFTTFDFPFDSPKAHAAPTEKLAPPLKLSKPEEAEKLIRGAEQTLGLDEPGFVDRNLPLDIQEVFEVMAGEVKQLSYDELKAKSGEQIPGLLIEIGNRGLCLILGIRDPREILLDLVGVNTFAEFVGKIIQAPPVSNLENLPLKEVRVDLISAGDTGFQVRLVPLADTAAKDADKNWIRFLSKKVETERIPVDEQPGAARAPTDSILGLSANTLLQAKVLINFPPREQMQLVKTDTPPSPSAQPITPNILKATQADQIHAAQLTESAEDNLRVLQVGVDTFTLTPDAASTAEPSMPTVVRITDASHSIEHEAPITQALEPEGEKGLALFGASSVAIEPYDVPTSPQASVNIVLPIETGLSPQPTVTTTMPPSAIHPTSLIITSAPIPSETMGEPTTLPVKPFAASVTPLDVKSQSPTLVTTEPTSDLTTSSPSVTTLFHLAGGTMVIPEPESPHTLDFSGRVTTSAPTTEFVAASGVNPQTYTADSRARETVRPEGAVALAMEPPAMAITPRPTVEGRVKHIGYLILLISLVISELFLMSSVGVNWNNVSGIPLLVRMPILIFISLTVSIMLYQATDALILSLAGLLKLHILPEADFSGGIPKGHKTAAVIPFLGLYPEDLDFFEKYMSPSIESNVDSNGNIVWVVLSGSPRQDIVNLELENIRLLRKKFPRVEIYYFHREPAMRNLGAKPGAYYDLLHWLRDINYENPKAKGIRLFDIIDGNLGALLGDGTKSDVEHAIILDSDSYLPEGFVHRMVGKIAADKDRKYTIYQSNLSIVDPSTSLEALNTAGGRRFYKGAWKMFGLGYYSGHGAGFNIDTYLERLHNKIPTYALTEDTPVGKLYAIAHDILEGTLGGRVAYLSDLTSFEGAPASVDSEMRKFSKWVRGSLRVGEFLWPYIPDGNAADLDNVTLSDRLFNRSGKLIRNRIPFFNQWLIFIAIDSILAPLVFVGFFISLFFGAYLNLFNPTLFYLILIITVPTIISAQIIMPSYGNMAKSFINFLFIAATSPYWLFYLVKICVTAIISGTKNMTWIPTKSLEFSDSELKKNTLERGQGLIAFVIVLAVFVALFMVVGPADLVNLIKDLAGKAAAFATLTTVALFSLWQVWLGLYIGALILYRVSYLAYLWLHNNILPVSPFSSYRGKPSPTRLDHGIPPFIMPSRLDLVIGVMLLAILGGWVGISLNLGNFNWAWEALSSILSYSATMDTGSLKMAGFGSGNILSDLIGLIVLLTLGQWKNLLNAVRKIIADIKIPVVWLRERIGGYLTEVSRWVNLLPKSVLIILISSSILASLPFILVSSSFIPIILKFIIVIPSLFLVTLPIVVSNLSDRERWFSLITLISVYIFSRITANSFSLPDSLNFLDFAFFSFIAGVILILNTNLVKKILGEGLTTTFLKSSLVWMRLGKWEVSRVLIRKNTILILGIIDASFILCIIGLIFWQATKGDPGLYEVGTLSILYIAIMSAYLFSSFSRQDFDNDKGPPVIKASSLLFNSFISFIGVGLSLIGERIQSLGEQGLIVNFHPIYGWLPDFGPAVTISIYAFWIYEGILYWFSNKTGFNFNRWLFRLPVVVLALSFFTIVELGNIEGISVGRPDPLDFIAIIGGVFVSLVGWIMIVRYLKEFSKSADKPAITKPAPARTSDEPPTLMTKATEETGTNLFIGKAGKGDGSIFQNIMQILSRLWGWLRERAGKWEVSRFSDFLVSVLTKKQSDETPIGKGSSQVAIDKVVYVPAELSGFTAVDLGRVTIGGGNNYEFARHEVLTQLERVYQDRLKQIIGFVSSYIGEQPLEVNIIIEPVQVDKPSAWYQSSSNAIHIQVILLTNLVPLEYAYFIAYYNFVLRAYGKKEVLAEAKKFLDTKSEVREVVLYTYTAESIPVEPVENWMEEEVKERRDNRFGMLWDRVKRDGFSVDRRTQDEYFALLLEFRIDGKLMIAVQEELKELLPESIIEKIAWNKPKTNHVTFVGFEVSEDDNRERVAGEIEEMSREILPGALKPFEFQAEGIGIMPTGALFVPMIIDISTLREIERIRMLYKQRTERVIFFSNPYIAHATVGNVIDELNNEEINVLFEALDKIRRKAWGRFYVNKVNFSQAIFYRDRKRDILESIKEFPVRKTLDEADVTKVLSLAASPLKGKLAILNWPVRILLAEQLLIHEGLHYLLAKLFGRETTGLILERERLGIGIRYHSPPAIEDKLIQITPAIINILIGIITLGLFLISPDKATYLPIVSLIISVRALYTGLIELTNKGELYEVTQVIKQTLNKALEWFKKIWINRIGVLRSKEGKILPRDEVDTYLDYLDDKGKLTLFKSIDRLSARIGFKNLPVQSRYIYIRLLTCKEPEGKNQEEKDVILRMVEEAESINQEVKERIKYLAENPILGGLSFLNTGKEILLGLINTGNPNEYQNFNNNVPLEGLPRVLLIGATNPQLRVGQFLAPPLGLHRIASFLRAFGIEVEIYDPNLRILQGGHNLEELVTTNRYDIIGISMLDQTLSEDSRLLNRLRELSPDSIFVTGGQGAQFNREGLFSETGVDAVIAGWGEYPLLEMVLAHRVGAPSATQFSRIRGVYTRNDAGEMNEARGVIPYQMEDLRLVTLLHDSASVPYDEYWDYIDRYYGEEHLKAISHEKFIHTVRVYFESHCPMGCDFCSSTNQLRDAYANLTDEEKTQLQALGVRNRILLLPAEDCMRVIKDIIRKHKPRLGAIFFNDDNFALDIARNHKLCDLAGKDDEFQKSGVYTYCLLRTDNLMADPTLWNRMYKDLHMGMVLMGGESFDDEVLKDMDKKVTGGAKTNKEAILFALRAGMVVNATLIMLHPAVNTLAKLMNTIDSCAELTEQAISLNAEEKLIFRPNFYVDPFSGAAITGEKAKRMNWKIDTKRYRVRPLQRAIEYIGDRSIEIQAELRKTVTYKHNWDRELLPEHVYALIIFLSLYKAADELILAYYEGSKLPDGIIKEDITGILDVEDIDKIQREIRKGIERLEGLIDKLMNKSKLITTSSLAASPLKGKLAILNWPVRILLAEQLLIHEGLHYLLAKLFGRETTGLILERERLGIGIRYHSPPDLKDKLIQKIPPIANILIGIITLGLFLISPDKATYLPIISLIISARALYTGLIELTNKGELYTKKRSESFLLLAEQTALDAKIIAVDFGGTLVPTNNIDIIALDDFLIQCVSAMELLLASDDELNIYIVSRGRIKERMEQILELYPGFRMLRGRRFHINEQVADKGKLMREVLQETDLSESSLIAIGNDESTDKPMALAKGHFIKIYPHTRHISPTALDVLSYILETKSRAHYRKSKLQLIVNWLKGKIEEINLKNFLRRKDKGI